jgi:hypothetical protein
MGVLEKPKRDNLELHEVLGFVQSFSANYSSRICKIHEHQLKVSWEEDNFRTKTSFDEVIEIGNVSLTGVKDECVFNQLDSFKVWENFSCDIMHVLLEGVFHYDLSLIINHFILKDYFSLVAS